MGILDILLEIIDDLAPKIYLPGKFNCHESTLKSIKQITPIPLI